MYLLQSKFTVKSWLGNLVNKLFMKTEAYKPMDERLQNLDTRLYNTERDLRQLKSLEDKLADLTSVNMDIHYKGPTNVIVLGRYRNKDYIKIFDIHESDLNEIIKDLERISIPSRFGRIDSMPGIDLTIDSYADNFDMKIKPRRTYGTKRESF